MIFGINNNIEIMQDYIFMAFTPSVFDKIILLQYGLTKLYDSVQQQRFKNISKF